MPLFTNNHEPDKQNYARFLHTHIFPQFENLTLWLVVWNVYLYCLKYLILILEENVFFFSFLFTWKYCVIYNSFFRPQRDHPRRHSWFLVAALKWDTTKLIDSTCPNHYSCWNLCILYDSLLSRLSLISILLYQYSEVQ